MIKKTDITPGDQEQGGNEQRFSLSKEEITAIVNKAIDERKVEVTSGVDVEKIVTAMIRASKEADNVDSKYGAVRADDIDPDDALAEPVIFIAFLSGLILNGDKRQGRAVRNPFGQPIFFGHNDTRREGTGKEVNLVHLAIYQCWSKIEAKFLLEHTLYGVMFFDNIKSAVTAEAKKATRIAGYVRSLDTVGQHQLISMARGMDIPVTGADLKNLRLTIAAKRAEEDMRLEEAEAKTRTVEAFKDGLMLSNNAQVL